jgi:hypothetical protein
VFGQEHGFDKPRTIADYRAAVPMRRYAEIEARCFASARAMSSIDCPRSTFANPASKSASIEFNTKLERHRDVIDFMSGLGYRLSSEQAARAVRTKAPYRGIG